MGKKILGEAKEKSMDHLVKKQNKKIIEAVEEFLNSLNKSNKDGEQLSVILGVGMSDSLVITTGGARSSLALLLVRIEHLVKSRLGERE